MRTLHDRAWNQRIHSTHVESLQNADLHCGGVVQHKEVGKEPAIRLILLFCEQTNENRHS